MTTTPSARRGPVPGHVAWVARRATGRSETAEHDASALVALVDAALDLGVGWLTVQDPSGGRALSERVAELSRRGVAVGGAAGPTFLVPTQHPRLRVVLAEEGSGRRELVAAVRELAAAGTAGKKVSEAAVAGALGAPDVDLLVLTADDHRVPDLLLWQVAYSEIVVLAEPWPEAVASQFHAAVDEYQRRDRRYGGLVTSR